MAYAKSQQTRARLVRSTAGLLRTKGYSATGLSDIVADSGVPKGSLYHHFPGGKQALAAESVRHSGRYIHQALTELADAAGDPVLAMRNFCDYYVAQLESSDYRKGCPLATVALEAAAHVDEVQGACAEAFEGIVSLFEDQLAERGLSRDDARDTAQFTVAAIEGALLLAKAHRSARPIVVVRDQLTRQLRAALKRETP